MKKEDNKFGDIVASKITLKKANNIRSKIVMELPNKWVFVHKVDDKYEVGVVNAFCGKLTTSELDDVKALVKSILKPNH